MISSVLQNLKNCQDKPASKMSALDFNYMKPLSNKTRSLHF